MSHLGAMIFLSSSAFSLATSGTGFLNPFSFSLKRKQLPNGTTGGDLITNGTRRWETNFWKFLSSSTMRNEDCDIEIINNSDSVIIFCWVDFDGALKHYYPISDRSINDKSVSNIHCENTQTNHVFICFTASNQQPRHISDLRPENFIFSYRPTRAQCRSVITVTRPVSANNNASQFVVSATCYDQDANDFEVIDSTDKVYHSLVLHGFTIKYEPGVFESTKTLLDDLTEDLMIVCKLLPLEACRKLQKDTFIWVNKSLMYGPKRKPIVGSSCCFHPSDKWLSKMGLSTEKAGGIEIALATSYTESRYLWGPGGLMLHELCHAYHFKHCPQGYDCPEVQECYTRAMADKLYDCVPVHGPQGRKGPVKAYACANPMEFFAELSVAFLFDHPRCSLSFSDKDFIRSELLRHSSNGKRAKIATREEQRESEIDDSSTAADIEYNKWFPHNSTQVRLHDPRTYAVLDKLWWP